MEKDTDWRPVETLLITVHQFLTPSNPNLTLNRKLLNVWVVETRVNARLGKRPGVSPGGMCRDLDEDSDAWTDVTTTDSRASASVSRSVRCHCVSVVHCLLATRPLCCCDYCSLSLSRCLNTSVAVNQTNTRSLASSSQITTLNTVDYGRCTSLKHDVISTCWCARSHALTDVIRDALTRQVIIYIDRHHLLYSFSKLLTCMSDMFSLVLMSVRAKKTKLLIRNWCNLLYGQH